MYILTNLSKISLIYSFFLKVLFYFRFLSSTTALENKDSWLNKLLVRKIEPTKESHSRMLSDKEVIYELQTDNVRPGSLNDYLKN